MDAGEQGMHAGFDGHVFVQRDCPGLGIGWIEGLDYQRRTGAIKDRGERAVFQADVVSPTDHSADEREREGGDKNLGDKLPARPRASLLEGHDIVV